MANSNIAVRYCQKFSKPLDKRKRFLYTYIHGVCIWRSIENEVNALPRNKYPEETVQVILEASLKLFMEKGFEQTTILDIVDAMGGLTRGAFYHHFKSKDEVLEALSSKLFYRHDSIEKAKQKKELNGLDKIKTILKSLVVDGTLDFENEKHTNMLKTTFSLLLHPRFLAEYIKGNQETSRLLEPIIEEGMADGSIQPGNPKILAELFILLINFWLVPTVYPSDKKEVQEKVLTTKTMFDSMGFFVIDEEMIKGFNYVFEKISID